MKKYIVEAKEKATSIEKYAVENGAVCGRYVDGKLEYYEVMSYWETQGYCKALESEGYTNAYDVSKAKAKLETAKQEYEDALEFYNMAKVNALIGSDN